MHEIWKPVLGFEGLYEVSEGKDTRKINRHTQGETMENG